HTGVVAVHAFGKHRDIEYMVMEHVSGVTLAHHLDRLEGTGMPLPERMRILIETGDALAAIHRAGLSHGDIKPENILLAASGRVVLTDLGLTRAAYEPDTGLLAGTPAYMAPETITPRIPNAGWPLVDTYAFGILSYRLLSGAHPWKAAHDVDLVIKHVEAPIPKLATVMSVPRRLSELVEQLMAKDPNDRP